MRICMILEGSYPYVRGGVSSWMHSLILANPQHEYVLWVIGAKAEQRGNFKYDLPPNVAEVHEIFLDDALRLTADRKKPRFTQEQIQALHQLVLCREPDWNVLFKLYNQQQANVLSFLKSEALLDILLSICEKDYPFMEFADFFHSIRSMFLPILYLISSHVPKADIYHTTATGYGGLLGALGSWKYQKPLIVTEHGIYTREREEELLRAKWVSPHFRQHWIDMFYMLSKCAYDSAVSVTALFGRYSQIQGDLGAAQEKRSVIRNGIRLDRFAVIPPKVPNGYIDITAVVRLHPIKDIKTLIYAFYSLKQRIPNARLHILGDTDDPEYGKECRALIGQLQLPDVLMPGNVDVTKYLEITDFTVLSSISEGQPLSVLEFLAAGRPAVTTDVGCCRDLIYGADADDRYGTAGIVVPPMHAQALANAMEAMATHAEMRQEMAVAGSRRVSQYYVHEDMVKKYNDNYEKVVSQWQVSVLN